MDVPVKNGGYDAVFSIAALHHVPSRELQLKALGECNRALSPDGYLLLTVWDLYRMKSLPYFLRSIFRSLFSFGDYSYKDLFVPWGRKNPKMRYCYAFTMRELRRLLMDAGFEIVESWTVGTGKSGNHVIVAKPFVPSSIRPGARIMGVDFDAVTLNESVALVARFLRSGRQHLVVTPNPEILLRANRDLKYRKILNKASLKVADGAGILWASLLVNSKGVKRIFRGLFELVGMVVMPWRSKRIFPERVTGVDLMEKLLDRSAVIGAKVFLLGAADGVADQVAEKWRVADIVGTYVGSPASRDESEIIKRVNESGANLLFVAYGAPKQEQWIDRNLKKMPNVKVAVGVGGAFDFVAGVQSRAPEMMQRAGLEWLWRVGREPRRIKRIFNATVRFPWKVMKG
jgi:N-acetylglucosaminyldiphosphoundecaprenol N-acetyl-beta-D-mannosaminyltransferase